MNTFTVITSKENKRGKFVSKLTTNMVVTMFGITKTSKKTFYLGGMDQPLQVGQEIQEDLTKLIIEDYPCYQSNVVDDEWENHDSMEEAEATGRETRTLQLSWIKGKKG